MDINSVYCCYGWTPMIIGAVILICLAVLI